MRNEPKCTCMITNETYNTIEKDERVTQISEQMKIADDQMVQLKELIQTLFNRLRPVLICTSSEKKPEKDVCLDLQLVPLAQWMHDYNLNIKQACESIENIIQLMEI